MLQNWNFQWFGIVWNEEILQTHDIPIFVFFWNLFNTVVLSLAHWVLYTIQWFGYISPTKTSSTTHFTDQKSHRRKISPTENFTDRKFQRRKISPTANFTDNEKFYRFFLIFFILFKFFRKFIIFLVVSFSNCFIEENLRDFQKITFLNIS
jgi:hypothetical protein